VETPCAYYLRSGRRGDLCSDHRSGGPGKVNYGFTVNNKPIDMNTETQKLIPVGKLKGEIDGEFDAFYLATDANGQLYINRNPGFTKAAYRGGNGWEHITRDQLAKYEKQLHFIPARKRQIRM
jgi:hypothetical protein